MGHLLHRFTVIVHLLANEYDIKIDNVRKILARLFKLINLQILSVFGNFTYLVQ